MSFKNIKELEAEKKDSWGITESILITKINTLKDIIKAIDGRIKDLEGMIEIDEVWETSTITYNQAEAIIEELKELKKRIEG